MKIHEIMESTRAQKKNSLHNMTASESTQRKRTNENFEVGASVVHKGELQVGTFEVVAVNSDAPDAKICKATYSAQQVLPRRLLSTRDNKGKNGIILPRRDEDHSLNRF